MSDHCEKCGSELNGESAHIQERDEIWCHTCADNAAEAAWARRCTDYEGPLPLIEQQRQALKFK